MCERSLQSQKEIHSARDVRLQFFHNRKIQSILGCRIQQQMTRNTFRQFRLSAYMKCYSYWPKLGCRMVDVSAQDASQDRLYVFEDTSDNGDICGGFCTL